jgi:hypothetical protein
VIGEDIVIPISLIVEARMRMELMLKVTMPGTDRVGTRVWVSAVLPTLSFHLALPSSRLFSKFFPFFYHVSNLI